MPKKLNGSADYGISREDRRWSVTLQRAGVRYTQQFSDDMFGSSDLAFLAAQARRDEIVQQHPPVARRIRASKVRVNNKSGIAGVTLTVDRNGTPFAWKAKTRVGDKTCQKSFSVLRWGSNARQLAIEERERQLLMFDGPAYVHPAEPALRGATPSIAPTPMSAEHIASVLNERRRTTNQSGTPGVVRRKGPGAHPGYWTAQTTWNRRWLSKSFSVALLGEDEAKRQAIAERMSQVVRLTAERQLAGKTPPANGSDCLSETERESAC